MEKVMLNLSVPSGLFFSTQRYPFEKPPIPGRAVLRFCPLSAIFTSTPARVVADEPELIPQLDKRYILLDSLRSKHLNNAAEDSHTTRPLPKSPAINNARNISKNQMVTGFGELGLFDESVMAVEKMGISVPTEIQCIGIPAVLQRKNVLLGSHTGSGKTLAYLLPIVQLLRMDEALHGIQMKPRRPRAIVLCPTRELSEQVFHVAKTIGHYARFKSTMVSGGVRMRPQEDALNERIDMVVGTPGRVLKHIKDGNIVYGDIKYLVLDEADTMFDRGFGPDIRKFIAPLRNRSSKPCDQGYQIVLVTATMTRAVQNLIDEEFQGIEHLHTSTLHKKIATARHDFIKLSGSENKLVALIQVLKPSVAMGNKVMIFCNTLTSCRAVDHFVGENNMYTVNYHGEVPAEQRVENLQKFKNEVGDSPALVCTDLAARGLDLDVDHVIMFDFPLNAIDYLHRTGRTARMGAKGKVTSLVAKRDAALAALIEDAITKNASLESLAVRPVIAKPKIKTNEGKIKTLIKTSNQKSKIQGVSVKTPGMISTRTRYGPKTEKLGPFPAKPTFRGSKGGSKEMDWKKRADIGKSSNSAPSKLSAFSHGKKESCTGKSGSSKDSVVQKPGHVKSGASSSKLRIVGFRGRSSMPKLVK